MGRSHSRRGPGAGGTFAAGGSKLQWLAEYTIQTEHEWGVYLDKGNGEGRENGRETDRERGGRGVREAETCRPLQKKGRKREDEQTGLVFLKGSFAPVYRLGIACHMHRSACTVPGPKEYAWMLTVSSHGRQQRRKFYPTFKK